MFNWFLTKMQSEKEWLSQQMVLEQSESHFQKKINLYLKILYKNYLKMNAWVDRTKNRSSPPDPPPPPAPSFSLKSINQ